MPLPATGRRRLNKHRPGRSIALILGSGSGVVDATAHYGPGSPCTGEFPFTRCARWELKSPGRPG